MPWDALPDHIDEPEEWKGTDWDNPFQGWLLKYKGWLAYSACGRSKYKWANWRPEPRVLFKIGGAGPWRYEDDARDGVSQWEGSYLSVIQYWKRWHFAILWPFHVSFHVYWKKKTVMAYPERGIDHNIFKMIFIRFGARRDSDKVYWCPSLYVGGDWN